MIIEFFGMAWLLLIWFLILGIFISDEIMNRIIEKMKRPTLFKRGFIVAYALIIANIGIGNTVLAVALLASVFLLHTENLALWDIKNGKH